jgi:predicted membrane channel-forming protein YqfA (hemolysin III family)
MDYIDYIPYIILIVTTSLLVLFTSLILYYKANETLLILFIITILVGIIGCCIYIYERSPEFKPKEKVETIEYVTYENV